jgi:hypothetical protein
MCYPARPYRRQPHKAKDLTIFEPCSVSMRRPRQKVKRQTASSAFSSLPSSRTNFAKLWSAVAIELPLGEGGDGSPRADVASITRCGTSPSTRPPKAVALPPQSKVLRTKPRPRAIEHSGAAGAHMYTRQGALRRRRRARVHLRGSITAPQARTCTPPGEHCGAAGAHVYTSGGALRRRRRARVHLRGSIAAPQARTCTPPGEHCGAAGAHVHTGEAR